jgi:amino acid permease
MYGIPFILLGNLAGNALALGRYIMLAAGHRDPSPGSMIGIAIVALSLVILLHMSSRRGGIFLNNVFAIYKVLFLLVIVIIGFVFRGGGLRQKEHLGGQNFAPKTSFAHMSKDFSDYTMSLLAVMYTYSGYEQPFYVSD